MAKKMCPVVHFELPAENRKRMSDFYTKTFGWETQLLGEEMNNYTLAMTTSCDGTGRPKEAGAINGGFYLKDADLPAQVPAVVIAVDDIKASMKDIASAGGEVLGEPMDIPGVGQYVAFMDTEGNRLCILQPKTRK